MAWTPPSPAVTTLSENRTALTNHGGARPTPACLRDDTDAEVAEEGAAEAACSARSASVRSCAGSAALSACQISRQRAAAAAPPAVARASGW